MSEKIDWQPIANDVKFIQKIRDQITSYGQLPFVIPVDNIPDIIKEAAEFFYRKSDDAVSERWVYIKYSDIIKNELNKAIQLEDDVFAVTRVESVGNYYPRNIRPYVNRPNILMRHGNNYSNFINGLSTNNSVQYNSIDSAIAMYEYSMSNFNNKRYITTNYNPVNNRLDILGDLKGQSIVLQVYAKIPIQELYADDRFRRYCVGLAFKKLRMVMGVLQFKMIGNVGINPSIYAEIGDEMIKEVKDELLEDQDDIVILRQ